MHRPIIRFSICAAVAGAVCCASIARSDTIIRMTFPYTNFSPYVDIELFDQTTPLTVQNFVNNVSAGDYTNDIIHRETQLATDGFGVIQGGSYDFNGSGSIVQVSGPTVPFENSIANTYGTIAMARLGDDLNSGSTGWFINTTDNTATLGADYTVFGRVLGTGMTLINAINTLPEGYLVPFLGSNDFASTPVINFNGVSLFVSNFVTMEGMSVLTPMAGDATLDGIINIDDYLSIDRGYAEHLSGWDNGDFNFDGTVDGADYYLLDQSFKAQGGGLAADEMISEHAAEFGAGYAADPEAVPEPASLGLLGLGCGALLRRRGKR